MLPLAFTFALAAATPAPAYGFFDGEGLVAACAATGETAIAKRALCYGYVSGAVDMILSQQAAASDRRTICPLPGMTLQAAVNAVLARASWASRARGIGAANFIKLALEDAYPCRADQDVM
jgi:hypothetical protein